MFKADEVFIFNARIEYISVCILKAQTTVCISQKINIKTMYDNFNAKIIITSFYIKDSRVTMTRALSEFVVVGAVAKALVHLSIAQMIY